MPTNPVGLPLEWCNASYRQKTTKSDDNKLSSSNEVLWRPNDPDTTPISRYRHRINKKFNLNLRNSHELHRWSVEDPHSFWIDLYSYCGLIPALPASTTHAYNPTAKFRDIPQFFPNITLNFAENILVPNTSRDADAIAITGLREGQLDDPEHITWGELTELVRMARSALIHNGVNKPDVIAALMSNSIWIIVLFLATSSIGAIFTTISPDMGLQGCLSRLSQVQPKLLFADIDYAVRGARRSLLKKVQQIQRGLPSSQQPPRTIFVPTTKAPHLKQNISYVRPLGDTLYMFLRSSRSQDKMAYTRVPTSHPLVIVYSSGTTGPPKCIVSPHMSILNYKKIAYLHNSLSPASIVFHYSSTSWVVWNITIGHLSVGARMITFDGNPLYPDASTPLRIIQRYNATYWGTSPRYLLELEQQSSHPASRIRTHPENFDLGSLRMTTTTGSTLTGSQMRWFYSVFPRHIHLSSVAGGTDIASSWAASDAAGPVYANEIQMWALGIDCDILDPNPEESIDPKTGKKQLQYTSLQSTGEPGELVCWRPLPSMPSGFWGDTGHVKYREAYFERFPLSADAVQDGQPEYVDVWAQHDFTTRNPATGGLQILGRSDGVLNPSGIRFGSSEIYSIVEAAPFNKEISDSLCVGRRREGDKDEEVFLFLIPHKGAKIDENLVARVKDAIRSGLSSRHVPQFVFEVREIPYTINGKKVETPVKKVISGIDVKVSSTIINPGCLKEYEEFRHTERGRQNRAKL